MLPGLAVHRGGDDRGRRLQQGEGALGPGEAGAVEAETAMLGEVDAAGPQVELRDLVEVIFIEVPARMSHDDDRAGRGLALHPVRDAVGRLSRAGQLECPGPASTILCHPTPERLILRPT